MNLEGEFLLLRLGTAGLKKLDALAIYLRETPKELFVYKERRKLRQDD